MGVVNVTPDSFSDGGRFIDPTAAVVHARRLVADGADVLDVGGESTRPGATPVAATEESARVVPVIARLAKDVDVPISVDTSKSSVAEEAIAAGACIVNDVSAGLSDAGMLPVVARHRAGVVLMHMRGDPRTMQADPAYADVVADVRAHLAARVEAAIVAGVRGDAIAVDPGLGFGKTVAHNVALLRRLGEIASIGKPVLVGASRKSFIGRLTAEGDAVPEPTDRVEGTIAAHAIAIAHGAAIVRAHDVKAAVRAARVADAIAGREGARGG